MQPAIEPTTGMENCTRGCQYDAVSAKISLVCDEKYIAEEISLAERSHSFDNTAEVFVMYHIYISNTLNKKKQYNVL